MTRLATIPAAALAAALLAPAERPSAAQAPASPNGHGAHAPAAPHGPGAGPAPADTGNLAGLPLAEVRARGVGAARPRAVAVLITGDGNWADLVQQVAGTLADSGVGVVGLRARAYLTGATRTPDDAAADVARIARTYAARWGAERVVLVGYSRGADMLPFVGSRLPADVRARVAGVAMFGLARSASFTFRWADLVRTVARGSDLPVAPELPRLRAALPGARLVCVYGTEEADSGCRDAPPALLTRVARPGAHHFDGDYPALAHAALATLAGAGA